MSFFFLLNPKHFLDAGGVVDSQHEDIVKKKKIFSAVLEEDDNEPVEKPEELEAVETEIKDYFAEYSAIIDNLNNLDAQLHAKIEEAAREALQAKRLEELRKRQFLAQQILAAEEEMIVMLIMMDS
jgi:hypothetical protein